jgi:hypothetical protein
MDEKTRTNILIHLTGGRTGKINHFCLKKKWYEKNNLIGVYDAIFKITDFLNGYDNVSLRERIFYIQSNLGSVKLCPYCNKNKLEYNPSCVCFRTRCSELNCKKLQTSIQSKINNENMTERDRLEKSKKCSIANKKSYVDRYGLERALEIKNKLKNINLGKMQSAETKIKRILTRKNNGKSWHTEKSKLKIKNSNKKTHGSIEFREKYKNVYELARNKQSETMKRKILNGEFTPCITNSWTRWKAFINIDVNEKKHFRSNWDAAFWLINKDNVDYESLRIPYKIDNKQKIYIVDFFDKTNKIAYEIKPQSLKNKAANIVKENALIEHCLKNNIIYKLVSDDWFRDNIHLIDFSKQPQLLKSFKKFI